MRDWGPSCYSARCEEEVRRSDHGTLVFSTVWALTMAEMTDRELNAHMDDYEQVSVLLT